MVLVQILDKPISAGFYGTPTTHFVWKIESRIPQTDSKGQFVRVGCWDANCWFHVAVGKNEKQTLANIRRRLSASMKRVGATGRFEYWERY